MQKKDLNLVYLLLYIVVMELLHLEGTQNQADKSGLQKRGIREILIIEIFIGILVLIYQWIILDHIYILMVLE